MLASTLPPVKLPCSATCFATWPLSALSFTVGLLTPSFDATPQRATPTSQATKCRSTIELTRPSSYMPLWELAGEIRRAPSSSSEAPSRHPPVATSLASPLIRSIMACWVIPQQRLKLLHTVPPRCEDHKKVDLGRQGSYKMPAIGASTLIRSFPSIAVSSCSHAFLYHRCRYPRGLPSHTGPIRDTSQGSQECQRLRQCHCALQAGAVRHLRA